MKNHWLKRKKDREQKVICFFETRCDVGSGIATYSGIAETCYLIYDNSDSLFVVSSSNRIRTFFNALTSKGSLKILKPDGQLKVFDDSSNLLEAWGLPQMVFSNVKIGYLEIQFQIDTMVPLRTIESKYIKDKG